MKKDIMKHRAVALIPARSGSKRIRDKNIKVLAGHPLMAYSIAAAKETNLFTDIICVTDSPEYAKIASHYGAIIPSLRPDETAGDTSADIEWVTWALSELAGLGNTYDAFSILRPTNPFRLSKSITAAWNMFVADSIADSLRAISLCTEHPGKMWIVEGNRMTPLMPNSVGNVPWHSNQYSNLPAIYTQNASLEIAWTSVVRDFGSIAGQNIIPFISQRFEGFDINSPDDWVIAQHYVTAGLASLPPIDGPQFQ